MPIRFIDEETEPKSKIRFIDDEPAQSQQPVGFFGGVKADLAQRGRNMMQNVDEMKQAKGRLNRELAGAEYGLRQTGEVLGGVGDITGRIVGPIAKFGYEKIARPILWPGEEEDKLKGLVTTIGGMTQDFTQANPRISKDISAGLNILGGVPVGAGTVLGIKGGAKGAQLTAKGLKLDRPLENFATRSQTRQVKINSPEWNMGARPEINAKYGVIGKKAEDAAGQWQALEDRIIENLNQRITGQLENPQNITSIENLKKHAYNVINRSNASQDEKLLQMAEVDNIMNRWGEIYPDGNINILEAQKLKIEQGRQGNWKSTGLGRVSNPKAPLESKAHNAIYDALKVNVENKGSEGIRELNKALSEIIPMKLSAEKRMMVDKRNNFSSLDDVVAATMALAGAAHGNPLGLIYAGGNMAVKSPLMAKTAYKTAQTIRGEKLPPGIKAIEDAISLPMKSSSPNLATPAYFRKGIDIESAGRGTPITDTRRQLPDYQNRIFDESRMLPAPMVGEATQQPQRMLPSIADRMRAMGNVEKDVPIVERSALPSPEDIRRLYPHLSNEDARTMLWKLNEERLLPAPMIETNVPGQVFEKQLPSVGDRIRSIGKVDSKTSNKDIGKSKRKINKSIGSQSGYVGTRGEHMQAEIDRFYGRPLSPKMQAYYDEYLGEPVKLSDLKTTIEKATPAQRSEMIKRLKKMYGEEGWKKYAPLFGTLGAGVGIPLGAITAYEYGKRRNK